MEPDMKLKPESTPRDAAETALEASKDTTSTWEAIARRSENRIARWDVAVRSTDKTVPCRTDRRR